MRRYLWREACNQLVEWQEVFDFLTVRSLSPLLKAVAGDGVSLSYLLTPTPLLTNTALLATSLTETPLPPDVWHRADRRVHLLCLRPTQPLSTAWSHQQRWHLCSGLDRPVCWHLSLLPVCSGHCRHHEVQQENSSGSKTLKLSTVLSWTDWWIVSSSLSTKFWLLVEEGEQRVP